MLKVIDILFVVFHTSLILFNLFGWIWHRTRVANLLTLLLTVASWNILGYIYKTPGYCPLTDWHFTILHKLGEENLPSSYVKYLADRLTGSDFNPEFIDALTLWSLVLAMLISILLNAKRFFKKRKSRK